MASTNSSSTATKAALETQVLTLGYTLPLNVGVSGLQKILTAHADSTKPMPYGLRRRGAAPVVHAKTAPAPVVTKPATVHPASEAKVTAKVTTSDPVDAGKPSPANARHDGPQAGPVSNPVQTGNGAAPQLYLVQAKDLAGGTYTPATAGQAVRYAYSLVTSAADADAILDLVSALDDAIRARLAKPVTAPVVEVKKHEAPKQPAPKQPEAKKPAPQQGNPNLKATIHTGTHPVTKPSLDLAAKLILVRAALSGTSKAAWEKAAKTAGVANTPEALAAWVAANTAPKVAAKAVAPATVLDEKPALLKRYAELGGNAGLAAKWGVDALKRNVAKLEAVPAPKAADKKADTDPFVPGCFTQQGNRLRKSEVLALLAKLGS